MKISGGSISIGSNESQGATAIISTPDNRIIRFDHPLVSPEPPVVLTGLILLATVEATGSDVSNLDFNDLDGDTHGFYLMEYHLKNTSPSPGSSINLQFNDDDTSISGTARSRRHTINSSAAQSTVYLTFADMSVADEVHEGNFTMNARTTLAGIAKPRLYIAVSSFYSAGNIYTRTYSGRWDNSVDNITKISLVSTLPNTIASGSWARLYYYE